MNEGIKEFFQAHMHHFKYVAIWQKKEVKIMVALVTKIEIRAIIGIEQRRISDGAERYGGKVASGLQ